MSMKQCTVDLTSRMRRLKRQKTKKLMKEWDWEAFTIAILKIYKQPNPENGFKVFLLQGWPILDSELWCIAKQVCGNMALASLPLEDSNTWPELSKPTLKPTEQQCDIFSQCKKSSFLCVEIISWSDIHFGSRCRRQCRRRRRRRRRRNHRIFSLLSSRQSPTEVVPFSSRNFFFWAIRGSRNWNWQNFNPSFFSENLADWENGCSFQSMFVF